jgi:hypothetical protein
MFQSHFYHESIRRTVSVFGTLFNNITVIRVDNSGKVLNQTKVPLAYGNKDKFLARIDQQASLQDAKIAIKLPRMSFELTGLTYDSSVKLQKGHRELVETHAPRGANNKNSLLGPIFYKLGIQLNIIAKNQDDALQILEQIIPFFQPQYTVTVKEVGSEFRSDYPFTLSSITMNDEYEGDYETRRALIYTLEFETKVRFYGPIEEASIIKKATINTGLTENYPETIVEQRTVAIVNPFNAAKEDDHVILVKQFSLDVPDWVQLELDRVAYDPLASTLLDNTQLLVGDFIVGTTNGSTGRIAAINGTVIDVINIDGIFEIGEVLLSKDKKVNYTIVDTTERWIPYV